MLERLKSSSRGRAGAFARATERWIDRPLGRFERVSLGLIFLIPIVLNAIALWPELAVAVPSTNDDMLHFLFIQRASEALANGDSILDFWVPNIEAGFPQFFYYQHLPALATVGIQRLTFDQLDLLTTMNLIRFVLLVGFPVTVLVALRWMGFSWLVAIMGATASSLLAGFGRYGFDYDSYIWRGWGMYTQLWAMHLAFLTIGASVRALHRGKGVWLAGLLLGVLLLTHLLYTYMTVFTIVIVAAWGIRRTNWAHRFVRLGIIGASAAVISAYMWLPLLTNTAYLNASPYLQSWKYDSLGAESILGWLVTGDLFDHDRLPVLTILFAAGVAAALLSRIRAGRMVLVLFVFWLLLWFGRPTWGSLMDVLPLSDGLILHRFAGLVTLTAIILMGIGGAVIWRAIAGRGTPGRVLAATAVVLLLLFPALGERWQYYDNNAFWMRQSAARLADDGGAQAILARLRELPVGRIYAGLPETFGNDVKFRDLAFSNVLTTDGYETLAPPSESLSLNSDLIWHLDDQDMAEYALWGVRYVVAPATRTLPASLVPILATDRWVLYEVPGASYGTFGELVDRRTVATQADLFQLNRAWQASGQPELGQFVRYDFPARVAVAEGQRVPGCPTGTIPFQSFQAGLIRFVVDCPVDSTFIVKTSYHPNWQITIDGEPVEDFMVSPSYIGASVPAGRHALTARYVAAPAKQPLAIAGIGMIILLLLSRSRVDRAADRVASGIARRVRVPAVRRSRTAGPPAG